MFLSAGLLTFMQGLPVKPLLRLVQHDVRRAELHGEPRLPAGGVVPGAGRGRGGEGGGGGRWRVSVHAAQHHAGATGRTDLHRLNQPGPTCTAALSARKPLVVSNRTRHNPVHLSFSALQALLPHGWGQQRAGRDGPLVYEGQWAEGAWTGAGTVYHAGSSRPRYIGQFG